MPTSKTPMQWFECWIEVIKGDFQRKLWISLFFVGIWSIWNQRNRVVFDEVETDWEFFNYLVRLRLGFWLKGWHLNCPFSPGEIASNLDGVRLWKMRKEQRPALLWCPPPPDKLKMNVDGSSKGKAGAACIGGVLRDNQGMVLAMLSAHVGIKYSNEAEFMDIVFALEMSIQQEYWIRNMEIIVNKTLKMYGWKGKKNAHAARVSYPIKRRICC